jgi:hypothetical protein
VLSFRAARLCQNCAVICLLTTMGLLSFVLHLRRRLNATRPSAVGDAMVVTVSCCHFGLAFETSSLNRAAIVVGENCFLARSLPTLPISLLISGL